MASIFKSFIWKFLERFGYLGTQFILQLVLARILSPDHYGVLSLMMVFVSLANVFIQTGFSTALIQNKDVTEADYSSVFWVTLVTAGVVYTTIFFAAPVISNFYKMPEMTFPLRILSLVLFPGAINSIQLAKVSREMDFKKVFVSNVGSVFISGIIGIIIALCGGGLWALVAQTLLATAISCVIMAFSVKCHIRFICNISRIKVLLRYGWKLLVSCLIDTLFQNLQSLVIGKKYNSDTLGYYNRGQQFPQAIVSVVNGSVQSVMLPAMSAKQDDVEKVKSITRKSICLSAYLLFPIMTGLAMVSPALISIMLTDKWLPCVIYLQICCITFAFYPIHSCNLQAINAIGRSDIFLKLEIIKKIVSIGLLAIAIFAFDSPLAIAVSGAIGVPFGLIINSFPNKKLIGYSFWEQITDWGPAMIMSIVMGVVVGIVGLLQINKFALLIIQVLTGAFVYMVLIILVKPLPYTIATEFINKKLNKN